VGRDTRPSRTEKDAIMRAVSGLIGVSNDIEVARKDSPHPPGAPANAADHAPEVLPAGLIGEPLRTAPLSLSVLYLGLWVVQ
jgi:hypothetical protein